MNIKVLQKAFSLLIALIILFASPVFAKYEKELEEINALLSKNKYYSAASYIENNDELMIEPRFIRLYSHIQTNYYVWTFNFSAFTLKDLEPDEKITDYRGKKGNSLVSASGLEQLLYEKYNEDPESPDLNFAVGEYIAMGEICGCGRPMLFVGDIGSDYPYFLKAYEAGIYDYFSLFRLGYHVHNDPKSDLREAIFYYEKSQELKPDHIPATYNLAVAYYLVNDLENARKYAKRALGKYGSADLNSDTYNLYGHIELASDNRASAEENLLRALELKPWHKSAFEALISIYRDEGREDEYINRVLDFIALDYSNTYMFNVYFDFLSDTGTNDWDKKISSLLDDKKFEKPIETGAVYFNLGRMAELMGDDELALGRYEKSLEAMKSLETPPEGAIAALKHAISRLSEE